MFLLDLIGSIYQAICFPIYGIPKVRRIDYIALDHHPLGYLNAIEKLNCDSCGYTNSVLAYFVEVAARTGPQRDARQKKSELADRGERGLNHPTGLR